MPGGRLTQQERQQIALGLADGLAYAEIARRIDRPTSTITREVMRNGGPTASELVQRLQVSAASVSKAIAFLEAQGLVRRRRDDRRRERYAVDDVWYQSMVAAARSNFQLAETARKGVAVLGPAAPAATRLENIARFVEFVGESIARAAEQARDVLHTRAEETRAEETRAEETRAEETRAEETRAESAFGGSVRM